LSSGYTSTYLAHKIAAIVTEKVCGAKGTVKGSQVRVLVKGITSKEDEACIKNSKAGDFATKVKGFFQNITIEDPHANSEEVLKNYGLTCVKKAKGKFDVILKAVDHREYKKLKKSYYKTISHEHTAFFDVSHILKNELVPEPKPCKRVTKKEEKHTHEHETGSNAEHLANKPISGKGTKKKEGPNRYGKPNLSSISLTNNSATYSEQPYPVASNLAHSSLVEPDAVESKLLPLDDLKLVQVRIIEDLSSQNVLNADAVLVSAKNKDETQSILKWVRSHTLKEIALKPLLIASESELSNTMHFMFDGVFDHVNKPRIYQKVKNIINRNKHFQSRVLEIDYDRFFMETTLQFLYSREMVLEPVLYRSASLGYAYSFIFSAIKQGDEMNAITLLNQMADLGYVKKKAVDKVHSCNQCSGGYLIYRECCPKCGTADIKTSDLIHHFACANVSPEEDYIIEDELICPKCNKTLRHIGVDYDKPSTMHTCNHCHHEFQEAQVNALCVDCGYDNELSQLGLEYMYSYTITGKGEHVARYGIYKENEEVRIGTSNIVSSDIFNLFKQQEINRVIETHCFSFEGKISIDVRLIEGFHKDRQLALQKEISTIIASYLTSKDLVCSPSVRTYYFLMCSSSIDRATQMRELFKKNITKLLSDGLGEYPDQVLVHITGLGGG